MHITRRGRPTRKIYKWLEEKLNADAVISRKTLEIIDNKEFVEAEYESIKSLWDLYETIRTKTNKILDAENERHKLHKTLISSDIIEYGKRVDRVLLIKYAKWSLKNKSK